MKQIYRHDEPQAECFIPSAQVGISEDISCNWLLHLCLMLARWSPETFIKSRSPIERNSSFFKPMAWYLLKFKAALPLDAFVCEIFVAFKGRGNRRDETSLCWNVLSVSVHFSMEIHLRIGRCRLLWPLGTYSLLLYVIKNTALCVSGVTLWPWNLVHFYCCPYSELYRGQYHPF